MPTVVHGDFEWDADEADLNVAKHGVTFEEAVAAMLDPLAVDFDDLAIPENVVLASPS
ncbi:MAG: BrnT family toxin [Myxococcales bacterium]|nr:BrnT family toxin [Myxococcales bacterium]